MAQTLNCGRDGNDTVSPGDGITTGRASFFPNGKVTVEQRTFPSISWEGVD